MHDFGQHAGQLIAHTLARNLRDFLRVSAHGGQRRRLKLKAKPSREAHTAQHPQLVLAKAIVRIADGAKQLRRQVGPPTHQVKHSTLVYCREGPCNHERSGVEQHAVDREIAPHHIFGRVGRKAHRLWPASIQIGSIVAECSDLDHPGGSFIAVRNRHDTKARTDFKRAWDQLCHLLRSGAGGNVEVLSLAAKQQVAHASASKVCRESVGLQRVRNLPAAARAGPLWAESLMA